MARLKCPGCPAEVVAGDLVCGNCGVLFVGSVQPVPMPEPSPEQEGGAAVEPESAAGIGGAFPLRSDFGAAGVAGEPAPAPGAGAGAGAGAETDARLAPDHGAGPVPPASASRRPGTPLPTTVDRAGVLELRFPGGSVVVRPGREVVLGRDPYLCPGTAARLAEYDNVSRRHATVGLDPDGTCWVRDEGSTNGTFVDGRELDLGERAALRDGAQLRLASDVVAQVRRLPDGPGEGG